MPTDTLKKAVALIKAKKTAEAHELLEQLTHDEPQNIPAWLYYKDTLTEDADKIRVLEACLEYNPDNKPVRDQLQEMKAVKKKPKSPARPPKPPTAGTTTERTARAKPEKPTEPSTELAEAITAQQTQLAALQKQVAELESSKAKIENHLRELKEAEKSQGKLTGDTEKAVAKLEKRRVDLEIQVQKAQFRLDQLQQKSELLEAQHLEQESQRKKQEAELSTLQSTMAKFRRSAVLEELVGRLEQSQQRILNDKKNLEQQLAETLKQKNMLELEVTRLQTAGQRAQTAQINKLLAENQALTQKLKELQKSAESDGRGPDGHSSKRAASANSAAPNIPDWLRKAQQGR